MEEFDFDPEELDGIVKINAKETLEILKKESGTLKGVKCYKEKGSILVEDTIISFSDFLVNKGETASTKYGKVLEFIVQELKK